MLFTLFFAISFNGKTKGTSNEIVSLNPTKNLLENIIAGQNYSKDVPPWDNGKQANVTVWISIPYLVLYSEENKQIVSYIAKINMTWNDRRLCYSSTVCDLRIPSSFVWIPTVETHNSVEIKFMDMETSSNEVEVRCDGSVTLVMKASLATICQFDVENFPFDSQYCSIGFTNGLTPGSLLRSITLNVSRQLVGTPEWQVNSLFGSTEEADQLRDGDRWYSFTQAKIVMKRNPQFYVYFLILPTFIITAVCLASLLLPIRIAAGERINLGVSGLLGLSFMLSVIVQEMPRTSFLPLLGKWVIVQIFFCVIGLVITPPIMVLKRRHPKRSHLIRFLSIFLFVIVILIHTLTSIFLFVFLPDQKDPHLYKTL